LKSFFKDEELLMFWVWHELDVTTPIEELDNIQFSLLREKFRKRELWTSPKWTIHPDYDIEINNLAIKAGWMGISDMRLLSFIETTLHINLHGFALPIKPSAMLTKKQADFVINRLSVLVSQLTRKKEKKEKIERWR
jgi:hypothetical protein